jgi:hypothetical protein
VHQKGSHRSAASPPEHGSYAQFDHQSEDDMQ